MKNNKKKGGRPALENKKQFRINVRFDESEHNRVLHNAKIAGMSKSEWVRKSAILRKITPRFTEEQLKAFRAITKKAHQSGLIEVTQECKNTIHHINHCINKLLHHDSEDN